MGMQGPDELGAKRKSKNTRNNNGINNLSTERKVREDHGSSRQQLERIILENVTGKDGIRKGMTYEKADE